MARRLLAASIRGNDWRMINLNDCFGRPLRALSSCLSHQMTAECHPRGCLLMAESVSPPVRSKADVKATPIYRRTKNLRAVQLLLRHSKPESTVRYLGIEIDEAPEIFEQPEI